MSRERLEKLSLVLKKEAEILEIQKNIRTRVEKEMGDTQREFILREQMKAIQQELGERDERGSEMDEYRAKIEAAGMPEQAAERALQRGGSPGEDAVRRAGRRRDPHLSGLAGRRCPGASPRPTTSISTRPTTS